MNGFKALLKVYLIQNFSWRSLSKEDKNKNIAKYVGFGILYLMMVALMSLFVFFSAAGMAGAGALEYLVCTIFLAVAIFILIMGAASMVSVIFFSKDNEILLALPMKSMPIYLVKMLIVYLTELAFAAALLIPMLIVMAVAGIFAGVAIPWYYWLLMIFSVFTVPMVPIAVASIIAYPLTYVASFFKKHSALGGLVYILIFAAIMTVYIVFIGMMNTGGGQELAENGIDINAIIGPLKTMGYVFYPGLVLSRAMLGIDVGMNLGIYLAILIGMIAIALGLTAVMYRYSLRSTIEFSSSKGKKEEVTEKDYKTSKSYVALMKRDLKEMVSNTALSFQTFSGIFLVPIMVLIMSFMMGSGFANGMETSPEGTPPMPEAFAPMMSLGIAMFMYLLMSSSTNLLCGIAISREGQNFGLLKTYPVSSKTILKSKLLIGDIFSTLVAAICAIGLYFTVGYSVLEIFLFLIMATAFSMVMNAMALTRDVKRPNLTWQSVKEMAKRSTNTLFPMLIGGIFGAILLIVAIVCAIYMPSEIGARAVFWSLWALFDVIIWIAFRLNVYKNNVPKFEVIE